MTNNIINQCPICGCKETDPDAGQMKLGFEEQAESPHPVPRNLPCESCERKLRNIFQAKYFFWIYKGSILQNEPALKLAGMAVSFGRKSEDDGEEG